ncbi:hypothetical protein EDB19DRAFT_1822549 [Suillus lakei]|nr:hypothetical protein EDB19DRAFT_1822549 [Suillus lakei]
MVLVLECYLCLWFCQSVADGEQVRESCLVGGWRIQANRSQGVFNCDIVYEEFALAWTERYHHAADISVPTQFGRKFPVNEIVFQLSSKKPKVNSAWESVSINTEENDHITKGTFDEERVADRDESADKITAHWIRPQNTA